MKLYSVIDKELGDRPPRLSDRRNLPYIEAAILELLRYSSTAPLGGPHCTTVDTFIHGYDIPKGTEVSERPIRLTFE